ncbi:MAG TPA: hypothetical protein VM661_05810 [Candidatus Sulfotelmatobacter sp.]|jgi:hypothetical protein|nr:hypothetical protein [Candidatus Sulfotelmatobacter sp.]
MLNDFNKTQEALTLIALARFTLDIAKGLQTPSPWDVKGRRELQDQARRLLVRVKEMRKG